MISSRFSVFSSERMPWDALRVVAIGRPLSLPPGAPSNPADARRARRIASTLGAWPADPIESGARPGATRAHRAGRRRRRTCGRPSSSPGRSARRCAPCSDDVCVVAKRATALPPLDVPVWVEPDDRAVRERESPTPSSAPTRAVLAYAVDLPLVTPLASCAPSPTRRGRSQVVPRAGGRLQPLLARYEPAALAALALRARPTAPDGHPWKRCPERARDRRGRGLHEREHARGTGRTIAQGIAPAVGIFAVSR